MNSMSVTFFFERNRNIEKQNQSVESETQIFHVTCPEFNARARILVK